MTAPRVLVHGPLQLGAQTICIGGIVERTDRLARLGRGRIDGIDHHGRHESSDRTFAADLEERAPERDPEEVPHRALCLGDACVETQRGHEGPCPIHAHRLERRRPQRCSSFCNISTAGTRIFE